jgi:hypothetical protein
MHPRIQKAAEQLVQQVRRRMAVLRARSYKAVFITGVATDRDREIVLADMRDHCFANAYTFHRDPYEAARRQGRREAWLRITQHLNLDEAKVQKLVEIDDGLGD